MSGTWTPWSTSRVLRQGEVGSECPPWRTGGRLETAAVVGGVLAWVFGADLVFLVEQGLLPTHLVCCASLRQVASPRLAHYQNDSMFFASRVGRDGREEGGSCHLRAGCPVKPPTAFPCRGFPSPPATGSFSWAESRPHWLCSPLTIACLLVGVAEPALILPTISFN